MDNKTVVIWIFFSMIVTGCTSFMNFIPPWRTHGVKQLDEHQEIWKEYNCQSEELPLLKIEHNELIPKRLNHKKKMECNIGLFMVCVIKSILRKLSAYFIPVFSIAVKWSSMMLKTIIYLNQGGGVWIPLSLFPSMSSPVCIPLKPNSPALIPESLNMTSGLRWTIPSLSNRLVSTAVFIVYVYGFFWCVPVFYCLVCSISKWLKDFTLKNT